MDCMADFMYKVGPFDGGSESTSIANYMYITIIRLSLSNTD